MANFSAALLFEQTISGRSCSSAPFQQVSANLARLRNQWSFDGACTVISNAERQARRGAKREAEIEALRAAISKAELARARAENHLMRQRVLDLETALASRQSVAESAQAKAASEVARLKDKANSWNSNSVTCGTGTTTRSPRRVA